jgi:tetratricopeptide (TPR) repeat protein
MIVAQAEGVPLYALETVRALVDRGALAHRDGRLAVVGELGELKVPATLSSLLTARLDALEPGERTLAKEVAVLGGAFPRAAAAALTSLDPGRVDGCLDALVRKQVLVVHGDPLSPDRGQYAFAQTLLRNVAYELLSRRERRPLHVAAAAQLREAFPNDGEEVAEVIAAHELDAYRAAVGDPDADELRDRAVASLRRAAARAESVGAQEAAERAYRSALELVPRWDERAALTEAAAEAALIAGRFAAAIELLEAATHEHEQAGRSREAARLTAGIGRVLTRMGQNAAALERMRSALDVLGEDTVEPAVAELNTQIAGALVWSGAPQEALPVIERALDMSSALALPRVLFEALNAKATCYSLFGRMDEALVLYHGMVAHAARHGLVRQRGIAESNVGDSLLRAGLPGAEPHIEAGIAICRQLGDRKGAELGTGNLMLAHILSGRWEDARGLAAAARGAGGDAESHVAAPLAVLHVLRGQHDEAREAASALAPWHESDSTDDRLLAVVLDALVEHAARPGPETLGRLLAALREAYESEGIGSDAFRAAWPAGLSGALALGRLDDAEMLVELLEAAPPGAIGAFLRAQRVRGRALVAAARGEHEGVEPGLRDATGQFRAIGYLPSVATTQLDLAAILLDRDEQREALTLLDEAAEVLERLGAAPELERVAALRARTVTADTVA